MTLRPPSAGNSPIRKTNVLNVQDYGARGNGTTDDLVAINETLDAAPASGATVYFPYGSYKFTGQLTVPSGVTVWAHEALFVPSGFNASCVLFDSPTARTPTTTYQLTADTTVGATTVTVSAADSANFTAGDRVTLRDADYLLGGESVKREMNVVDSVNTGTGVITLSHRLGHVYTAANDSWIAKVTTADSVKWLGGQVDMDAMAGGITADVDFIEALYPEDCLVEGVTVYNHPDRAINFYGGLNSRIRDCNGYSPDLVGAGEGYTTSLAYSRNCVIEGGWSYNARHHADIAGGQSCGIDGGRAAGDTASATTGAFLHGMESRWSWIRGFQAENLDVAFGAGNSTFGGDYEFTIEDCRSIGCTTPVLLYKSSGRLVRPYIRNPAGIGVDVTNDNADVDIVDPDIDMGTAAFNAIGSSGMTATTKVRVRGGTVRFNDASTNPIQFNAGASTQVVVENVYVTGTMLRAVYFTGAGTDRSVSGCRFRGTIGEQIRFDAGNLTVQACEFAASGSNVAVRAAGAGTLTLGRNTWGGATSKVSNTGGSTLVGIVDHLTGTATWDPASVANGAMTSTTVTVTGAAVGDPVMAGFSNAVPAGCLLVGAVTSANTVTVTLHNNSGSTQDLASGTLRATVVKHA